MSEQFNTDANPPKNGTASASFNEIIGDVEKIIIQEHPQSKSDDESSECTPKLLGSEITLEMLLDQMECSSKTSQLILDELREITERLIRIEANMPTLSAGRAGPVQRFFDGI